MFARISSASRSSRTPTTNYFFRNHASSSKGKNEAVTEMLRKHRDTEESSPTRNAYKVRAYNNAIKALSDLEYPIQLRGQARMIPGIGNGISRRIDDFLQPRADSDIPKNTILQVAQANLETVPGIGKESARKLVEAGCMGIADLGLKQYYSMLKHAQKVGFKYLKHLEKSVSREEAETVAQFIRDNISSKYEVILTGSYRRGSASSSDIDIVLLHPNHVFVPIPDIPPNQPVLQDRIHKQINRVAYVTEAVKSTSPLFSEVVPLMQERGLIAETLSNGVRRWHGVVRIPEKGEDGRWCHRDSRFSGIQNMTGEYRRLDLNLVPLRSRGAGLIAFTGDTQLNKDLRKRAVKMGMHLNEFGLWRWNSNGSATEDSVSTTDDYNGANGFWQLVRAPTEQDIFTQLGMEYIEPHRRNFGFI